MYRMVKRLSTCRKELRVLAEAEERMHYEKVRQIGRRLGV